MISQSAGFVIITSLQKRKLGITETPCLVTKFYLLGDSFFIFFEELKFNGKKSVCVWTVNMCRKMEKM